MTNKKRYGLSLPNRLSIAFVVFYGVVKLMDGFAIELVGFLFALAAYLVLPHQDSASTNQPL
ncbi:hypothetical protein [Vibrio sp. R78045]|uniref:hypothetical protein n=1 Tax=Vibrio sp. R78045 TaxID=3093868 RepID=UPI0036F34FF7